MPQCLPWGYTSLLFRHRHCCSSSASPGGSEIMCSGLGVRKRCLCHSRVKILREVTMRSPQLADKVPVVAAAPTFPTRMSNREVFPAPDAPMIAKICPESTAPLTPFRIFFSPCFSPIKADLAFEMFTLKRMSWKRKSTFGDSEVPDDTPEAILGAARAHRGSIGPRVDQAKRCAHTASFRGVSLLVGRRHSCAPRTAQCQFLRTTTKCLPSSKSMTVPSDPLNIRFRKKMPRR